MQFKKIVIATSVFLAASMASAQAAPKAVDLSKLYAKYEKAEYSSLDVLDTSKKVLISGVVLSISESLGGNSILKVGARANSQELARLAAADNVQEDKLNALQPGSKFKAVYDLAFSSGTLYMSFQQCIFQ